MIVYLARLKNDLAIQDNESSSLKYVQAKLDEAWKNKRSMHDDTASLRDEFLQVLFQNDSLGAGVGRVDLAAQVRRVRGD